MKLGRAEVGGVELPVEVDGEAVHVLDGDIARGYTRIGTSHDLASVTLVSPSAPRTVFCTLSGWMPLDGSPLPPGTVPKVTPKVTSTMGGPGAVVVLPPFVSSIWVEPEIAVVIGTETHRASPEEARAAIFGFTIFNDATAYEYLDAGDYYRAKSIESFATMGPVITTDLTDDDVVAGVDLTCRVNGEARATANTKNLKFAPSAIVSALSQYTKFLPGDVISLGCPPPDPPVAVAGDAVEHEIDGIGILTCSVVASPDAP